MGSQRDQGPGLMAGTECTLLCLGVTDSTPISQLEKLRHREIKELAYTHGWKLEKLLSYL